MFEVSPSKVNLMNEYKSLIVKKINDKKVCNTLFITEKDILKAVPPLSKKELMDMADESELPVFCDDYFSDVETEVLKDFVETRVGEDFIILPDLENQVFCLHSIEDYVLGDSFLEKKDKPTQLVRINEKNKAA